LRNCRWLRSALVIFCIASGFVGRCAAQDRSLPVSITSEQQRGVSALAQMIQKELLKEKCAGANCQVLVVNLALPSGQTCSACVLLSDSLAKTLGELPDAPTVITRTSFSSFMDRERISYKFLKDREAMKWIGHQFHATDVVFGEVKPENDSLRLNTQVLQFKGKGDSTRTSKEINVEMPLGNLADGLSARESFEPLAKRDLSLVNARPLDASLTAQKNTKLPACFSMPNPRYTQAARDAKFSGSLIVEGIVTRQGKVIEHRIVRGLPFGLNESSIETLSTWRCDPAVQDGVPIAVLVPFEVTFRLY
jgi:TonB family protein